MTEPLTLRDLDAIGVERMKGVGDKKLASLQTSASIPSSIC